LFYVLIAKELVLMGTVKIDSKVFKTHISEMFVYFCISIFTKALSFIPNNRKSPEREKIILKKTMYFKHLNLSS